MFSSENLMLHTSISTLELKNFKVRWYVKDAILTDRALYLYKERSNYVHDAHQRLRPAQFRASIPSENAAAAYVSDLAPMSPHEVIVEMMNQETRKVRVLACRSQEDAEKFVKLLNLVSSFSRFEQAVEKHQVRVEQMLENQVMETQLAKELTDLFVKDNLYRIEQWIQNFVLDRGDQNGCIFTFQGEQSSQFNGVLQLLHRFFKEELQGIRFVDNLITDSLFQSQIFALIQNFSNLQVIEIKNNKLALGCLETFTRLFPICNQIRELNLSGNCIGVNQSFEENGPLENYQKSQIDNFLLKFFTQLRHPKLLNLSYNYLTDSCLEPIIKYTFANHVCHLETLNLENNRFSARANRTLMKAYAISPIRAQLTFINGPLPLSLDNLRSNFITKLDRNLIHILQDPEQQQSEYGELQDEDEEEEGSEDEEGRVLGKRDGGEEESGAGGDGEGQVIDIVIQRKSNNFKESHSILKRPPITLSDRQRLQQEQAKIVEIVENRDDIEIETLKEFVERITGPEIDFELPRYLLAPIFDIVNQKLDVAIELENIYMIEVLLDCLKFMNARNEPAEKKYYELANEAQRIIISLIRVINMEINDDNQMQKELVQCLKRGKRIGLRGELIDTARHLYILADKNLTEMRGKETAVSDDEDEAIYEVNEEDRPLNVYDMKLDKFIDMSADDLGLTSEVEIYLAAHPYSTDYLKISNLNQNYVKKNLNEAKKFLKDEESYAYRNIFERCSVLLSNAGESSDMSITYNLARNDQNLKLTRLIFRYKNNLDKLFPQKQEPEPPSLACFRRLTNVIFPDFNRSYIENIKKYYNLRSGSMFNPGQPMILNSSLTVLSSDIDNKTALAFNNAAIQIIKGDLQYSNINEKTQLYKQTQELFEKYIVTPCGHPKAPALPPGSPSKSAAACPTRLMNTHLADEFYLQLFRLASICQSSQQMGAIDSRSFNCLLLMSLLSNYMVPCNRHLHQGIYNWLLRMSQGKLAGGGGQSLTGEAVPTIPRVLSKALNNFHAALDTEQGSEDAGGEPVDQDQDGDDLDGGSTSKINALTQVRKEAGDAKFQNHLTGTHSWPPSTFEIASLVQGVPVTVSVLLPSTEELPAEVNELTTVESLLESIFQTASFQKEHETETLWLFRRQSALPPSALNDAGSGEAAYQEFDYPLPREKKILKLLYQAEKETLNETEKAPKLRKAATLLRVGTKLSNEQPFAMDPLQKMQFIVKRRIFPSLFTYKSFSKLPRSTLEQAFFQARDDYVEKNILKEVCVQDDVIFFGALILKVKLQGKLLRSKQKRISAEDIRKQIEYGVPSFYLKRDGSLVAGGRVAREPSFWAESIEKQYFQKKEFADYSLEDVQEKFLAGIGLYNSMFSSYYVLQKEVGDRRDNESRTLMSQIAAQRGSGMARAGGFSPYDESQSDDESNAESEPSQKQKLAGKVADHTIINEASSRDEKSGSFVSEALSDEDEGRRKKPDKREGSTVVDSSSRSQFQPSRTGSRVFGTFWSQVSEDNILLVVNIQGVQILENSKRDRIVHHIDYEDILYVMGKGEKLKIGFQYNLPLLQQAQGSDCRSELFACRLAGFKARVIAEDIIAYAQLRLVEMTKNDVLELTHKHKVDALFDQIGPTQGAGGEEGRLGSLEREERENYESGLNTTGQGFGGKKNRESSFKGLVDLKIDQADLLDSDDLENDQYEGLMKDIGQHRNTQRNAKNSAEMYKVTIAGQLGKCIHYKEANFLAFRRRYPILNPYVGPSAGDGETTKENGYTTTQSVSEVARPGTVVMFSKEASQVNTVSSNQSPESSQHTSVVSGSIGQVSRAPIQLIQPPIDEDKPENEESMIREQPAQLSQKSADQVKQSTDAFLQAVRKMQSGQNSPALSSMDEQQKEQGWNTKPASKPLSEMGDDKQSASVPKSRTSTSSRPDFLAMDTAEERKVALGAILESIKPTFSLDSP